MQCVCLQQCEHATCHTPHAACHFRPHNYLLQFFKRLQCKGLIASQNLCVSVCVWLPQFAAGLLHCHHLAGLLNRRRKWRTIMHRFQVNFSCGAFYTRCQSMRTRGLRARHFVSPSVCLPVCLLVCLPVCVLFVTVCVCVCMCVKRLNKRQHLK